MHEVGLGTGTPTVVVLLCVFFDAISNSVDKKKMFPEPMKILG